MNCEQCGHHQGDHYTTGPLTGCATVYQVSNGHAVCMCPKYEGHEQMGLFE